MDSQVVRVQEVQGPSGGGDAGNVPRAVECELVENMVDSCSAGDVVTVTGIATPSSDDRGGGGGGSKAKSQFRGSCASSLYVKALSVVTGPGPGGREPKPGEVGDEDDYEMTCIKHRQKGPTDRCTRRIEVGHRITLHRSPCSPASIWKR